MAREQIIDTREEITEESLLIEARERMDDSLTYEQENRSEAETDLLFKLGGHNQWPAHIVKDRLQDARPILTINKLPTFTDQVIGDSRANKVSIKVRPTGKEGSKEVAKILDGLIRNIQKESDSNAVYQWGLQCAVDSGLGAWTVDIVHIDDNAFEKELVIKRISNPYTVYLDPKAQEPTSKDGRYAFITELISRKEFKARYPGKVPSDLPKQGIADDLKFWFQEEDVRIAEYWVKRPLKKRIYLLADNRVVSGEKWDAVKDDLKEKEEIFHIVDGVPEVGPAPGDEQEVVLNEVPEIVDERTVESHQVLMYLIDGSQIIDGPNVWPGKYIPIIPVQGKEININGKKHLRGIIRNARDPQAIYNYERTEEIERNALAKMPPMIATAEQMEGHDWNNDQNDAVRIYTHVAGQERPSATIPPQASSGNIAQAAAANDEMNATTGLNPPNLGLTSGAGSSGIKEQVLQQKGDIGTLEYHDNQARAIKFTGDILVDLIPPVYDNERSIVVIGEDESEGFKTINQKVFDKEGNQTHIINDLSIGRYAAAVSVGPSFSTQRVETAN
ncbi:MAG TPA: hypothetical protein ENI07_10440, partial [Desulfobacterales bacterium]|nr:hypothetical protein [Desulfobacterales bacterium]